MSDEVATRVRHYVELPDAADHVRLYFATGDDGAQRYTGALFERLGGGGDAPEVANRFVADDLVAVTMLSVEVPGRTAAWMLGDGANQLSALLSEIPNDIDLWEAAEESVADGSAADRLWRELDNRYGIGRVIAGKLMARKRPRLIPVYDRVVGEAVGAPDNWWLSLRTALRQSDGELVGGLASIRDEADVSDISLLRVLDIIIWMQEHGRKS